MHVKELWLKNLLEIFDIVTKLNDMVELKKLQIQYLKTTSGETTAVVIPIRQWIQLEEDYQKILQYTKLKNGLKSAFREIKNIKAGTVKKVSMREFLDEC